MRRTSIAVLVLLSLVFAAGGAALAGKSPVDVSGSAFGGPGKLKAKIKGYGSEKGPADFFIEFGPGVGLAEDGFRLTFDDGDETITVIGTYGLDEKGKKYVLTPDGPALTAEMTELFWRYVGGEVAGVSIDLDVRRIKIKAKPKVKKKTGETTFKLGVKFAFIVTASALGQTETVKTTLTYKGKGVEAD